jgi:hypothetical protein
MSDDVSEKVVSGETWEEFCDSLKDLGKFITREDAPTDDFNRAEGFRYLTRLLRNGLESTIEGGSPEFPAMRSLGNMVKMGADNPDNLYQGASINGAYEYRISGQRGSVYYLSFASISGGYGTDGTMITDGFIDDKTLEVNDDGSFEVILSQHEKPGNWVQLTDKTRSLNIRQTFLDRSTEKPAQLNIERLDSTGTPPPYSAERLARDLNRVSAYLHGTVKLFADWSNSFRPDINTLPPADQAYCQSIGGDPNIFYFHSYWELADDEVLVIKAPRIPECQTWNFQLDNYWLESLDYRFHKITVNMHTAKYEEDGSVILYVTHQDPEAGGNWIDTAGHNIGTMCWRWIGTDDHPELEVEVKKVSDL